MNSFMRLSRRISHLKTQIRSFYASTPPTFEEEQVKTLLRPLEGQGGNIVLNYNQAKGIAVITIENINRKNALTGLMMVQLSDIVDELETWTPGKAIILQGQGGTFASGADISVVQEIFTPDDGAKMCFFMHRTLTRLRRLPLVSVAVVQGHAVGGGAELATACDFRLMCKNAEIRFVQARMNVSPGWGGGAQLVKLVGRQKALEILLQSKKMGFTESLRCGLVDDELCMDETKDAVETAADWLKPYLVSYAPVVRAIKGVVAAGDDMIMDNALDIERCIFGTVWGSETARNAFTQSKHR